MKKVVQCTGVIITICGWLLINAEHFSGSYPLVAPKYLRAMEAYHHIDENLEVLLKEGDVGFDEIAQESRSGGIVTKLFDRCQYSGTTPG